MRLSDVARWTPLHWILTGIATLIAIGAVFVVANGLSFRWDPLNLADKRADRAVASAGRARVDASARRVETAGAQATTQKVERAAADRAAATEIAHRYTIQLEAPAHDPMPVPDDGADLRDVFGELCHLRPAVCANPGHTAPAGHAGDGPPVVSDPAAPG
jgi:hypothetical protein